MSALRPRHAATLWTLAFGILVAVTGTSSTGQTPTGAAARPPARQNAPLIVMSPKATSGGWTGVHKPHTKLRDVLARHNDQADWAETIVDDESLNAQWISMGPGQKTPRRMNGDTREWWIVQSGTLRFTVEGREPLVATQRRHGPGAVPHAVSDRERRNGSSTALRGQRGAGTQAVSSR